ncbi:N-acetyltransferase [Marihabitans asiaticum]|uniref:Putative acetyltransferase n=1 Tax=Marihabitans asiaticum TaxID=415218 RepID=A0A560WHN1_9MICO|nr:N-acetyltransferase [Marihabitans asiaticum]TWD17201.1 putative acetyltransferase [Marihabitans asiaticum]
MSAPDLRDALVLRPQTRADDAAVAALVDSAFATDAGGAGTVERRLLGELRADGDLVPELTLVAEVDGAVVGQVACSTGDLAGRPSIGLGPICVRPDLQGRGIGAALMSAVIATAERRGDPVIVLLGDPDYYGFFGFVPAVDLGIGSPGPWPDRFFQAKALRAWRPELAGPFRYAPAFERLKD